MSLVVRVDGEDVVAVAIAGQQFTVHKGQITIPDDLAGAIEHRSDLTVLGRVGEVDRQAERERQAHDAEIEEIRRVVEDEDDKPSPSTTQPADSPLTSIPVEHDDSARSNPQGKGKRS